MLIKANIKYKSRKLVFSKHFCVFMLFQCVDLIKIPRAVGNLWLSQLTAKKQVRCQQWWSICFVTRFVFQWFVFWWFHFEFQFWISTVKRNRKIGATTAAWLQNPFWKHVFTQINFDKVWYLIGEFYKVWTKLHSS